VLFFPKQNQNSTIILVPCIFWFDYLFFSIIFIAFIIYLPIVDILMAALFFIIGECF
jgi:hypothetical protein